MFKSKKKDDGDDPNRKALFGRSKNKSPAPSDNPYAQPIPDAYTQAKINAGVAPPRPGGLPSGPKGGLPSGPKGGMPPSRGGYGSQASMGQPPPPYGDDNKYGPPAGGFGAEKYGNQGGYGGDRYGQNPYGGQPMSSPGQRKGGYGGLGGNDVSDDNNRDALFGGARDRVKQPSYGQGAGGYDPSQEGNQSGGYGDGPNSRSYGAYQDRQLTAEEGSSKTLLNQAEGTNIHARRRGRYQSYEARCKLAQLRETSFKYFTYTEQIRHMKEQDISSTRNALRIAQQGYSTFLAPSRYKTNIFSTAEESGRGTLARLGQIILIIQALNH